jgi:hypothetical protein
MNDWINYNLDIIKLVQEMYSINESKDVEHYISKLDYILKKKRESTLSFNEKEQQYSDDYKFLLDLMPIEHSMYVRAVNAKAWAGCNWKNVE